MCYYYLYRPPLETLLLELAVADSPSAAALELELAAAIDAEDKGCCVQAFPIGFYNVNRSYKFQKTWLVVMIR